MAARHGTVVEEDLAVRVAADGDLRDVEDEALAGGRAAHDGELGQTGILGAHVDVGKGDVGHEIERLGLAHGARQVVHVLVHSNPSCVVGSLYD